MLFSRHANDPGLGPNEPRIDALLARARTLTEAEAIAIFEEHRKLLASTGYLGVALRDVVYAMRRSERETMALRAERLGRSAVTVFPGTARGRGVAGIVGRAAEALVVADEVPAETLQFLLRPLREAISEI